MSVIGPLAGERDAAAIMDDLRRRIPGYTSEWSPASPTAASGLMHVFARYMELLRAGLAQAPARGQLAFLDMLGTHLLSAQSARVPLVFSLIEDSPVDVTLPAGSQVAAVIKPAAPMPFKPAPDRSPPTEPVIFSTEQTVTLSRGRLAALYSIDPGTDAFADHTARLTQGFGLFDELQPTEHAIYLGHDPLFALAGDITVLLSFTLETAVSRGLKTQWEYLTEGGWVPLESLPQDDTTQGFTRDGQIALRRECGPKAKQETRFGHKSYWLRGRLTTPLLPEGTGGQRTMPVINDIRARLEFNKDGLQAEAAFADGVPLDVTKDFYPFGQQPARYATFYLASKEVFQRKGARVGISLRLSQVGDAHSLTTEWEYFDGMAWSGLGAKASTGADTFTEDGTVSFLCPRGWEETIVNGVMNYWLRVRISDGDYGQPSQMITTRNITAISVDRLTITVDTNYGFAGGEVVILADAVGKPKERVTIARSEGDDTVVLTAAIPGNVEFSGGTLVAATGAPTLLPSSLQPPVIAKLSLGFSYLTPPEVPELCLSINDFVSEDHTEACRWPDQILRPFRPVADRQPAVHFGFDRPLPVGLVGFYVDVPQAAAENADASPFTWEYRSRHGWSELGVLDETDGFRRSGMIQFIGPPDATSIAGMGGELYRIRARLKQGQRASALPIAGIWLNAAWATQSTLIEHEPLGLSDGNPSQTFLLARSPALDGETVEVQEWIGRGEHWQTAVQDVPEGDLRFERDRANNAVTAVWVRWYAQPHLYQSGAANRHCVIERERGQIRFGDGRNGLIPSAGSRVTASYRSGGGLAGNVPAGAISELRTALPYVLGATNPVPASGGAEIETTTSVNERGPQRLRHRDRAVSAADFEWLAREASPDVAQARCMPITGPDGHAQRGWVTIVVVPHGLEKQPAVTPELRRRVREYLARRVPAAIARRVSVIGPRFVSIRVQAEIAPTRPDQAAAVEARVRERLDRFLHPLAGGPHGEGWVFGQTVYASQIAREIEGVEGVDYARRIGLSVDEQLFDEFVPVDADALASAGEHELKLIVGGN